MNIQTPVMILENFEVEIHTICFPPLIEFTFTYIMAPLEHKTFGHIQQKNFLHKKNIN